MWDEQLTPEDLEWLEKEAQEALDSYPEDEPVRRCWKCGQPMRYNSMAYHEGFHFDSCY